MEDIGTPFLQVELVPGENSNRTLLGMGYEADFVDSQRILIKLLFDTASAVSANQPEDILKLSFWGPFFDAVDGLPLDVSNIVIEAPLPPQVPAGAVTETIAATGDAMQATSITVLAGNSIINLLLAGSLAEVWGMINNL